MPAAFCRVLTAVVFLLLALPAIPAFAQTAASAPIPWSRCLDQPAAWYGGGEAVRIAGNVLLYQHNNGGWNKNIDMATVLDDKAKAELVRQKSDPESTIDNGATYTQLRFLARVHAATKKPACKDAFLKGLDYLLAAQYANGGWPQFYPLRKGYWSHITFNDDAMIGVMELLRDVARKESNVSFVDEARRARCETSVQKGVDCILKCQVIVDGKRTAWCAQHDEKTLAPAPARAFEMVSLSGSESVPIVRFLMGIERPSPEVIRAIQAAVAWFDAVKLTGVRYEWWTGPAYENGRDRVIVADSAAPPLWARFYEIGTNRPIFSGRDSIVRYRVAEIEHERRTGYAWYTNRPGVLLTEDYPRWQRRWAPENNVLKPTRATALDSRVWP